MGRWVSAANFLDEVCLIFDTGCDAVLFPFSSLGFWAGEEDRCDQNDGDEVDPEAPGNLAVDVELPT